MNDMRRFWLAVKLAKEIQHGAQTSPRVLLAPVTRGRALRIKRIQRHAAQEEHAARVAEFNAAAEAGTLICAVHGVNCPELKKPIDERSH